VKARSVSFNRPDMLQEVCTPAKLLSDSLKKQFFDESILIVFGF
jgi:hypothetical protein